MRRVTSTSSHCKHASPPWNTSGRQGRKPGNHQAEKPEFVVEVKKNGVPKASRKIIVSIDQYPAVTLCDISQTFDAFSQDCSYVLPDVLKAKVVRCFKQEMRAEFHFEPGRFRRDRSRNEHSALAECQHICTLAPSQGLTPDHQTLQARPLVLSGSADPPFNSLTGCKCAWDWAASKDPGLKGVESLSNRNKSIAGQSKHVPVRSRTPLSVEENRVIGKFCNRMCTPTRPDAPGTSPGVVCQNTKDTCQRARAYFWKTSSSCARTDMPWPLPNSGLTRASHTATPACPAPPAGPTDTVDSPISSNDKDAQSGYPRETLLGAPEGSSSGPAQCIYHKKDESGDGENGELVRNISSRSPDSTNIGFAPNSLQAETQPSTPSDGHGRESSDDVNSPLHTDQCDHSRTTPSPSAVLLSDMERTSSSYPISPPSSFQPGEVRSVSLVDLSSPCSITGPLENHLFFFKDARMASFNSSSSESSLLLPQYKRDCDEEPFSGLPQLLPYYERSISDDENNTLYSLLYDTWRETENALPPILSPVTSPHTPSWSPVSSYRMEDTYSHEPPQLVNDKGILGVDQGSGEVLNPAPPTEPQFSPSNHNGAKRSSPSTGASDNGDQACADALDEVTAYKQDILLVDVTQDDAELFQNLPQTSLLKLGPVRVSEELKCRPVRTAKRQQLNSDRLQVELGHR